MTRTSSDDRDYLLVAAFIDDVRAHATEPIVLDDTARRLGISTRQLHDLFERWAGVEPETFLHYITAGHARAMFDEATIPSGQTSMMDTGHAITLDVMTPDDYRDHGRNLHIRYGFGTSRFGDYIVASTARGICHLHFNDDANTALHDLRMRWSNAHLESTTDDHHRAADAFLHDDTESGPPIRLHVKGTPFQLKVWNALLRIPEGSLRSYSGLARSLGLGNTSSRAVGTANGSNSIGYIIPCHRVVTSEGGITGFRWGQTRKLALIGWEASRALALASGSSSPILQTGTSDLPWAKPMSLA